MLGGGFKEEAQMLHRILRVHVSGSLGGSKFKVLQVKVDRQVKSF